MPMHFGHTFGENIAWKSLINGYPKLRLLDRSSQRRPPPAKNMRATCPQGGTPQQWHTQCGYRVTMPLLVAWSSLASHSPPVHRPDKNHPLTTPCRPAFARPQFSDIYCRSEPLSQSPRARTRRTSLPTYVIMSPD
jgi:hypothetical protein